MKKILLEKTLCFIFAAFLGISACFAGGLKNTSSDAAGGKLKVVTTIFPEYDWVKNIAGDNVDLVLLMDHGADMHSWHPSSSDIVKVSTADVFVYVGGESDAWVNGSLATSVNKNQVSINLMEVLKNAIRKEEVVEGMQAEDKKAESVNLHAKEEVEYDEHVWLSVRNAKTVCSYITEILCNMDKAHADTYRSNSEAYLNKLSILDKKYASVVKESKRQVVLFGDRFPFRYLVDDYNIDYYAAFVGCSAETEASFKTITFLVSKVDELNLPAVFVIENSDKKIANTIIQNTKKKNQKIFVLDSMQATTAKQIAAGKDYIGIMEDNLAMFNVALN